MFFPAAGGTNWATLDIEFMGDFAKHWCLAGALEIFHS